MKYKVTLNNRVYEVEVEEGQAMLIDEYESVAPVSVSYQSAALAPSAATAPAAAPAQTQPAIASGEVIKSPMPGNILKINVTHGQHVEEGDVLLVLEAMKMENEVVANKAGTVAQIVVSKGAVVETGSALVVIA